VIAGDRQANIEEERRMCRENCAMLVVLLATGTTPLWIAIRAGLVATP